MFDASPPFPQGAVLIAPAGELSWSHVGRCRVAFAITAPEVWQRVMAEPLPLMKTAFRIRDSISARFGVKRIGGFSGRVSIPPVGEKLDFFTVEAVSDRVLALSERDRHLDVMACVTAIPDAGGTEVAITGSVRVKTGFGRAYMIPVGPAHRLIVAALLRRLRRLGPPSVVGRGAGSTNPV